MRIFVLFLLIFFASSAGVFAQKTDNQFWSDVQFIIPLKTTLDSKKKKTDKIVLNLDGIVRFGRNDSFPVDDRAAASVDFRVNKFLKLAPGYLYQRAEQNPRQRSYETRFSFAALLEKKLNPFTLRHRSMFEYRARNFRPDTVIYRARFQLLYSLKRKNKEIFAPFVSEEFYDDLKQHSVNRNEFFAGITRKLSSKLSFDLFYIRASSPALNVNAIGATLKIRLR